MNSRQKKYTNVLIYIYIYMYVYIYLYNCISNIKKNNLSDTGHIKLKKTKKKKNKILFIKIESSYHFAINFALFPNIKKNPH